jgi:hypothetical protein
MSHVSSVKPTQSSLSNPLLPSSRAHQPAFLLVLNLIARPPCAIAPLPVLRDIVQVGFVSTPWNDANANESVLCAKCRYIPSRVLFTAKIPMAPAE